ncbi:MAG: hypothetical protein EPN25_14075, partial [Nitrospirae bacterium]
HPVFGLVILQAKREGAKLLVADSKETKLTRHSTSHLKMRPGTSVALLNGISRIIVEKGLFNREIVSRMEAFPAFEKSLEPYTSARVSEITGIPADALIAAAAELASAKDRMICFSLGFTENTKDADLVLAASNLLILLGEETSALQVPAEYANTYGLYAVGLRPDAEAPNGRTLFDMLYEEGAVKGLYIMGEDPVSSFPYNAKILSTLRNLELLIVQDIAMTETARLADVVLPAAAWGEKDGTFINAEGVAQKAVKIVDAPGQALPDWLILRNLALAMGREIAVRNVSDVTAEIMAATQNEENKADKRVFIPVDYTPGEETDAAYPLTLVTRDVLQHSGTMSTRSKSLDLVVSEALLEISPQDAVRLGITENSHVKISTRRGSVYLKAKISETIPEGRVFAPVHFPHGRVNSLTYPSDNGKSGTDAVRVEAVKG